MLAIGDVYVFVSDFDRALRFYTQAFGLEVFEQEITDASSFAQLDFPDGGPSIRLVGPVEPWEPGTRPEAGTKPTIRFDIMTNDFDNTVVRILESGGDQHGEIESYEDLRVVTMADPDGNTFELLEVPDDWE